MTGDARTLDWYSAHAGAYADANAKYADTPFLARFAGMLPPGGRVLDFGCGPGWAGGWLLSQGFAAEGYDGSEGLAAEARRRHGLPVTVGVFADFAAPPTPFDGVWCSFALLHAPRAEMPDHLARLTGTLAAGGAFYLGMKLGEGEERDRLGRLYTYYSEDALLGLVADAGLSVVDTGRTEDIGMDGTMAIGHHILARNG